MLRRLHEILLQATCGPFITSALDHNFWTRHPSRSPSIKGLWL